MVKTLEDTNIMRRVVGGRRLTYGSEADGVELLLGILSWC